MFIGKVIGNVVSSHKEKQFEKVKLLIVQPFSPYDNSNSGKPFIAVDTVDAGIGDRVLVVDEGGSARQLLGLPTGPLRTSIAGYIDNIYIGLAQQGLK